MTIKEECEKLYETIEKSQQRLTILRQLCKHKDTSIGNYSWRIGVIEKAEICNSCGEVIKLKTNLQI